MITGAHSIIYSKDAEADRRFFKDILKLPHVDVDHGWLIFGLPPAELAVHPSGRNSLHEFYFMVEDIRIFVNRMKEHHITCSPIGNQSWGLVTQLNLPGGGKLGVYLARHARPGSNRRRNSSFREGHIGERYKPKRK